MIYSTFYAKSLELLHMLDHDAELGILDIKVSNCLYKLKCGCVAVALYHYWRGIDLSADEIKNIL